MSVKGCHRRRVMNRIARSCDPRGLTVSGLAVYANAHRIHPREWQRAGWRPELCRDALTRKPQSNPGKAPEALRGLLLRIYRHAQGVHEGSFFGCRRCA